MKILHAFEDLFEDLFSSGKRQLFFLHELFQRHALDVFFIYRQFPVCFFIAADLRNMDIRVFLEPGKDSDIVVFQCLFQQKNMMHGIHQDHLSVMIGNIYFFKFDIFRIFSVGYTHVCILTWRPKWTKARQSIWKR